MNAEDATKAVEAKTLHAMQIIKYEVVPKGLQERFNNLYLKNFNPAWTEDKIRQVFSQFGEVSSCLISSKKVVKDGVELPHSYVCFNQKGNPSHGFEAALKAVKELHDKEVDGFKIYVQPFLPAKKRLAIAQRDSIRYKNSKKKCNLFVKNFPDYYKKEDLAEIFGQCGEIESIRMIEKLLENGYVQAFRAFVCFKQPDSAA